MSDDHAGRKPNRLLAEKSPYLLQHAYNPVDWYPWGVEAFERARLEDKPIFSPRGVPPGEALSAAAAIGTAP